MDRPWRTIAEIYPLLGYKSLKAAQNAVSAGRFPVKTYVLSGKRVVDLVVVETFFADHREAGLTELRESR